MCFAATDKTPRKPSIAIQISTAAKQFILGSDVDIHLAATNVSGTDISLPYDDSKKAELCGFRVFLLDHPECKITKFYWKLTGRQAPEEKVINPDQEFVIVDSVGPIRMPPGRTVDYVTNLKDLYSMDTPGTYEVQLEKADPVTHALVKSNVLKITVKRPDDLIEPQPPQVCAAT